MRFLVLEIDVTFFGLALFDHDVDFIAGLEVDIALPVLTSAIGTRPSDFSPMSTTT